MGCCSLLQNTLQQRCSAVPGDGINMESILPVPCWFRSWKCRSELFLGSVFCVWPRSSSVLTPWWLSPASHWCRALWLGPVPESLPGSAWPARSQLPHEGRWWLTEDPEAGVLSPESVPLGRKAVPQRGVWHCSPSPCLSGTRGALVPVALGSLSGPVFAQSSCKKQSPVPGVITPGRRFLPRERRLPFSCLSPAQWERDWHSHGRASVPVRKYYTNQQLYHKVPPVWQHPRGELFSNNQNLTYFQLV